MEVSSQDSASSETSEESSSLDDQQDEVQPITYCRLCQNDADVDYKDIFTSKTPTLDDNDDENDSEKAAGSTDDDERVLYVAVLKELIQIEYEEHELLSRRICKKCILMIQLFRKFCHYLREGENKMQIQLHKIKMTFDKYRPGLNGNPGVFEPDSDCEIIEIDPNGDFYSSDEEFSESTESEEEEAQNDTMMMEEGDDDFEDEDVSNAQSNNTERLVDETTELANVEMKKLDSGPVKTAPTFVQVSHNVVGAHSVGSVPDGVAMNTTSDGHPKNTFLCQFCDLAFTTQTDCHDHEVQQHDPALPFRCSFCHVHLSTRQLLISHIRESHDPGRPYVCTACNKGFVRRSDLKKHTIVHTGVRPFTCAICSKSFSRNTNLTKHMRIHSGEKPFVCQVCPRSFQTAVDLMRHTRSHSEVKPYHCERCSTSFTRKDKLLLHEQVHIRRDAELLLQQARMAGASGMTPVNNMTMVASAANASSNETENNGKQLYPNSILAAQLQQQMPSKQYPAVASSMPPPPTIPLVASVLPMPKPAHSRNFYCEICDKTFQRERDLQRHKALHLDTLFTCKLCGIGFSRAEKLARHELEHHAPHYPCDICRITFARQEELELHMKMHELQQNVALNTQAAMNASASAVSHTPELAQDVQQPMALPPPPPLQVPRPSAADMSFYSQMVPTMNLGFYSETHPEERNGV